MGNEQVTEGIEKRSCPRRFTRSGGEAPTGCRRAARPFVMRVVPSPRWNSVRPARRPAEGMSDDSRRRPRHPLPRDTQGHGSRNRFAHETFGAKSKETHSAPFAAAGCGERPSCWILGRPGIVTVVGPTPYCPSRALDGGTLTLFSPRNRAHHASSRFTLPRNHAEVRSSEPQLADSW